MEGRRSRKRACDKRICVLAAKQATREMVEKLPEQALDPKLCKALGVNDINDILLDDGVQATVQEKIDEYFKDACLYLRSCLLL